MAEEGGEAAAKATLSAEQRLLLRRRQELDLWQRNAQRLRRRNLLTGLATGAFVLVSYTILSVKQERIMDDLDNEARIQIVRGPRTGANS